MGIQWTYFVSFMDSNCCQLVLIGELEGRSNDGICDGSNTLYPPVI